MGAPEASADRGKRMVLGRQGEAAAAVFLRRRGFTILARNVRSRLGELDLVARHGGTIVFVEVKTRRSPAAEPPQIAVDPRKQMRIVRAAQGYLAYRPGPTARCRFDVVAVTFPREGGSAGAPRIEHFPHAFEVGGWAR